MENEIFSFSLNVFIFGHAGFFLLCTDFPSGCSEQSLLSSCGAQASHRGGSSC